jgi:hypothetical protein
MKTSTHNLVESILGGSPSRAYARRRVAEMALGIVEAIRHGGMPAARASEDVFTMDNRLAIRRLRLGAELVEVFQWGMQLEDVAELAPGPEALNESLDAIERIAHEVLAAPRFRRRRARGHGTRSLSPAEGGGIYRVPPAGVRRARLRSRVSLGR